MPYDAALADRVRAALAGRDDVTEKTMFGTLVFMVGGSMAVAAAADGLLVRVGDAALDAALAEPDAAPARMGGRPMKGWVLVAPEADLASWIARATQP
jgi:TfoX/Sxy family transcriptional regulator of competence genes